MWYKFQNGKQKIDNEKRNRRKFFKQHAGLEKFLDKLLENNFKEIARGEFTEEDIVAEIKREFGIDIPKEYFVQ
jgi:hypothetical protein